MSWDRIACQRVRENDADDAALQIGEPALACFERQLSGLLPGYPRTASDVADRRSGHAAAWKRATARYFECGVHARHGVCAQGSERSGRITAGALFMLGTEGDCADRPFAGDAAHKVHYCSNAEENGGGGLRALPGGGGDDSKVASSVREVRAGPRGGNRGGAARAPERFERFGRRKSGSRW